MSMIHDIQSATGVPEINVIPSDVFHARVRQTFNMISEVLSRSMGPCGAPAVISNMPQYHITKDGHTIAKSILFENKLGYVDSVIAVMIMDICDRLNSLVGDGTTAATVGTAAMYDAFCEYKDRLERAFFLPRDIIYRLKYLKDRIIKELEKEASPIKSLPHDEMVSAIREVVYISSNGDEGLSDMIADMYDQIGYPGITVEESKTGVTEGKVVSGYPFPAQLTDRLYINNDDGTCVETGLDAIIFDHKVGRDGFRLIQTLRKLVLARRRKLLIMAPAFDSRSLQELGAELNAEYASFGSVSTILTVFPISRECERKRAGDMAMLLNTTIINERLEKVLIGMLEDGSKNPFNLDMRGILGTYVMSVEIMDDTHPAYMSPKMLKASREGGGSCYKKLSAEDASLYDIKNGITDESLRVGFVDNASISETGAVFSGFHYSERLYDKFVEDAEQDYAASVEKYKITGAYNSEIDHSQERLNSLRFRVGALYVGASTEFSTGFEKDTVTDAVKAASSAYFNGTILGGHVSTMRAIRNLGREDIPESDLILLKIIEAGFATVNHMILTNAFPDYQVSPDDFDEHDEGGSTGVILKMKSGSIVFDDPEAFNDAYVRTEVVEGNPKCPYIMDLIREYEILTGTVLDLQARYDSGSPRLYFSKKVINSTATDREILTAAIDLVALLITGNQLILARPIS